MKALLTIAAGRDVVERVNKVYVHSVVIHLGRGTFVASSRLSLFFCFSFCSFYESLIVKKCSVNVFLCLFSFSNFSNTFLTSFGRFFSKIQL